MTQKSISERFQAHLDRAIVERSPIQKALAKYGKDNFSLELIDVAANREELVAKEIYWISFYNTFTGRGYNLTRGGDGVHMTNDLRKKISDARLGKPNLKLRGRNISEEQRIEISRTLGCDGVIMYNPSTKHEIRLQYVNEGRKYGFNPSNISSVCRNKRPHTKGYKCFYISQGNPDPIDSLKNESAVQRLGSETVLTEYNLPTRSQPLK